MYYEQKHPLERKIKFFLDIRGIIKTNNIKGLYVEYGCYQCETMFCAEKILGGTNNIDKYYGLDTFDSSVLKLSEKDKTNNTWDRENKFIVENENFLNNLNKKFFLIKGDFRNKEILEKINFCNQKINISIIDSNFISSLEISISHTLENITSGGFIFIDDYFTNLEKGIPHVHNIFKKELKKRNLYSIEYKTYPPFAKSFIIFRE